MNKDFKNNIIVSSWVLFTSQCDLEQNKKAALFNRVAFYVHRELKTILPKLIISSLNQKLLIQPNDLLNIQSCANLRVLTGTAFYLYSLFSNGTMQGVI